MNNSVINVDLMQLNQLSESIKNSNQRLNSILSAIIKDLQLIEGIWDSEGGNAYLNFLTPIKDDMIESSNFIVQYAKFLDQVVETYEECEKGQQRFASYFN